MTSSTTNTSAIFNRQSGSAPTSYEVTALTGVNTARVLQLVSRIRW